MQIAIFAKNIDLTGALRTHVERKLSKLDRYIHADLTAQVSLAVEKDRHRIEVTIPIEGWILRAEEETEDLYASVDLVVDKLERQLHKYKTRLTRKVRQPAAGSEPPRPAAAPANGEVVRVKQFALKPMTRDEAILQMQLLGHDFFVFRDAEAGGVTGVVYRRRGGGVGLIEPEA